MAIVRKRGNSYQIRVSCGYTPDGIQIIEAITWTPPVGMSSSMIKKELKKQTVMFEERVKSGRFISNNITFSAFSQIWLHKYADVELAPKTVHRYRELLKKINESIGHIKLDKLQPHHFVDFYQKLRTGDEKNAVTYVIRKESIHIITDSGMTKTQLAEKSGVAPNTFRKVMDEKAVSETVANTVSKAFGCQKLILFQKSDKNMQLSDRTVLAHHRLISSILNDAVEWQLIYDNPVKRVKSPRVKKPDVFYLDDKQAIELIRLLLNSPIDFRTMILLILFLGLRRSELCGLKWKDIDFFNATISIRRSLQYLPENGLFEKSTKNDSSCRTIFFSKDLNDILKEYMKWQTKQKEIAGDLWVNQDWIFTTWNGTPINPDSLTARFNRFIKGTSLPKVTIHGLRHTNATLLIGAGVDLRTVANRLGHSQTSTTTNIYAHAINSADKSASVILSDVLNKSKLL